MTTSLPRDPDDPLPSSFRVFAPLWVIRVRVEEIGVTEIRAQFMRSVLVLLIGMHVPQSAPLGAPLELFGHMEGTGVTGLVSLSVAAIAESLDISTWGHTSIPEFLFF